MCVCVRLHFQEACVSSKEQEHAGILFTALAQKLKDPVYEPLMENGACQCNTETLSIPVCAARCGKTRPSATAKGMCGYPKIPGSEGDRVVLREHAPKGFVTHHPCRYQYHVQDKNLRPYHHSLCSSRHVDHIPSPPTTRTARDRETARATSMRSKCCTGATSFQGPNSPSNPQGLTGGLAKWSVRRSGLCGKESLFNECPTRCTWSESCCFSSPSSSSSAVIVITQKLLSLRAISQDRNVFDAVNASSIRSFEPPGHYGWVNGRILDKATKTSALVEKHALHVFLLT